VNINCRYLAGCKETLAEILGFSSDKNYYLNIVEEVGWLCHS